MSAAKPSHTPTPWVAAGGTAIFGDTETPRPYNIVVAECEVEEDHHERNIANAQHIVKCVNAHDELVAIVQEVAKGRVNMIDEDFARARSVLAKLEGGAK